MKNTKALGEELIETKIYLNEDFKNEKEAPAYKVTAPNGYTEIFRQAISDNCQHKKMWENCGCTVEKIIKDREIRSCNINGIEIRRIDTNIISYISKGKALASENYINKVKPGLILLGMSINHHECEPYAPKRRQKDCHDGTILDKKYADAML